MGGGGGRGRRLWRQLPLQNGGEVTVWYGASVGRGAWGLGGGPVLGAVAAFLGLGEYLVRRDLVGCAKDPDGRKVSGASS